MGSGGPRRLTDELRVESGDQRELPDELRVGCGGQRGVNRLRVGSDGQSRLTDGLRDIVEDWF